MSLLPLLLAVSAASAPVDFREPALVPRPKTLAYEARQAVVLSDALPVDVRCPDATAVSWVEKRFGEWFGAHPSVKRSAGDTVGGLEGSYRLEATPASVMIEAETLQGVRYAMYTLRQTAERLSGGVVTRGYQLPALHIDDAPELDFRALHLCWFPEQSTQLIEHQIRLAAYYKFNYVILESWGVFRSERYPSLCVENAPLTVAEAHRLAALARDLGVTLIPQVNIFGHATMARGAVGKHVALDVHPELQPLFEPQGGWNWCLSNPEARSVVRDFADEIHKAFDCPPYFHLGCDEADEPSCATCRAARPYASLVERHIVETHDMFAEKGVRTMIWHDMLLSRGDARWRGLVANGREDAENLLARLPKDLIICDWHYNGARADYPSLDHFRTNGFATVTCAWDDQEGIAAQGKYAREHGLFGFMETVWHHYRGEAFAHMMRLSAQAAWNGRAPYGNQWHHPFATHWRQTGWDQPLLDRREHGYNDTQVTREILDR